MLVKGRGDDEGVEKDEKEGGGRGRARGEIGNITIMMAVRAATMMNDHNSAKQLQWCMEEEECSWKKR